ncbi:hypothetical protein BH10BDE1_BH10BDE1_01310 [soil metagenome]
MSLRVEFVFCETPQVEKFRLSFELLEHDFSRRWLAALLNVLEKPEPLEWNNSGALFVDEAHVRCTVESLSAVVHEKTGVQLLEKPIRMFATADDLKPIRETCFEIIKKHSRDSVEHVEIRGAASNVIRSLVQYESLYAPDHHFHGDFSFQTETRYFLAAADFAQFTPDRNDGWLYLDCAQADLTPISAYLQNSNVPPTAQVSFNPTAQILYRDTFSYELAEKEKMRKWIARALGARSTAKKLSIGQIPLARPVHSMARTEVLEKLIQFRGTVAVEAFQDGERLLADQPTVQSELAKLKPFHPYGAGPVGDMINALIHFGRFLVALWGLRWKLLIPFHRARPYAWAFGFALTWPFRKTYYFTRHVFFRGLGLLADVGGLLIRFRYAVASWWGRRWQLLVPFHKLRPAIWEFCFRASWPFRKAFYVVKHVVTKYVFRKSDPRG